MPKRKGGAIRVDFTGVEAGGGGRLLPEGSYKFEVEEVTVETGEDSGKQYFAAVLKVVDGEYEGTRAYDNLSLQPQALWKLRGFMEAAGLETVDGEMDIDPSEFEGLVVIGQVIHEDYKGKTKHRIDGYSPVEDDPAPAAAEKGGARRKPAKSAEYSEGDEVSFMDGKKKLTGKITEVDGKTVTVKVGKEEYEMETSDLIE